tara:strand:+ start:676 stop:993 length:318 start_codon:yes stop_codon:yes gene_type:complete
MASILNTSIDLTKIPKDKIIDGKKGKYINISITINDELDKFGNNGPVTVGQTEEERKSKTEKIYLGNVKVVWSNGNNVDPTPQTGATTQPKQNTTIDTVENDLPF